MALAYSTNTHSYIIAFCLRFMGLKAYMDCLYQETVWDSALNHEEKLVQVNSV